MIRLILAALCLSATSALAYPVTVKSCNREVTFDKAPTRAVSNDVNLTEMMLVLGLRDHMAGYSGISGWKTLDPAMREAWPNCPSFRRNIPAKRCWPAPMPISSLPAGTMA